MRRVMFVVVVLAAVVAGPARAGAVAEPTPQQAEELGREAYRYGFPLLEFLRVRAEQTSVACPDLHGNAPVNSFSNAGGFTRPDDRTVVAPNTDTLYSIAHLDLAKGPVILSHPDMGDRYFVFELLDPYTNVIDYVGSRSTGSDAAQYAIRWAGHPGAKAADVDGTIKSKYRRVWIIGRTLATDAADQRKAQRLMRQYQLARAGHGPRHFGRDCDPGDPAEFPTPTDGITFLDDLATALAQNPPPKRDAPLMTRLASVGIGPGSRPADAGLPADVLDALYAGVEDEAATLPGRVRAESLQRSIAAGGWLQIDDDIGDYGTDYDLRATVAVVGLGANTTEEAIYPVGLSDSGGSLLSGTRQYRVTFAPGQEPPARYFWSLTMYDLEGYLVPNPIGRYSVGPTHPPFVRRPDGSIVIAIQATEPTEAGVNWLPSPTTGNFRLNLRLFGPRKAALDHTWTPPPIIPEG